MTRKPRTILTPANTSDFSAETKTVFWKQILPLSTINYTDKSGKTRKINFDKEYLTDLATAFDEKVLDQTPFLLADADNRHTMDPERHRAEVVEMKIEESGDNPGLYAKLKFSSKDAAAAVINNPKLGVSARIREGIQKSDGTTARRGIIHVLGTLDPQVTGMAPWEPVDLSKRYKDNVLDLSNGTYSKGGKAVAKKTVAIKDRELDSFTEEEIDGFTEDQLAEFAAAFLSDEVDSEVEDENDEEDDEIVDTKTKEPVSLSQGKGKNSDLDLANQAIAVANARATEALRRQGIAEWNATRAELLTEGVPAAVLDLAAPVLSRPDALVIDLSNTEDDDLDVSKIVLALVEEFKGTVDLSNESGHDGSFSAEDGEDPDAAILAAWDN